MKTWLRASFSALAFIAALPVMAASDWKAYSTPEGQAPQALSLGDLAGKTVDLKSLKGQVVLLNFWATWCEPCRDEMPAMNRLQQKFGARGLRVIAVNLGESRPRIEQFLRTTPVDFLILRDDDSAVSKAWRVRVLPASFLLDRNGMLRYQLVGEAKWDSPSLQAPILELLK
jgi:cytochrome c biogenesis protein CcmG/thiol:disulfide interchange protein DsbE